MHKAKPTKKNINKALYGFVPTIKVAVRLRIVDIA